MHVDDKELQPNNAQRGQRVFIDSQQQRGSAINHKPKLRDDRRL